MNFLFTRANNYLNCFEHCLQMYKADESFLCEMCYLLQQSMEHYIKAILEYKGVSYPTTHRFSIMLNVLQDNNITIPCSDVILKYADDFDKWSTDTRYNSNFFATFKLVEEAKTICYALKDYTQQLLESANYSLEAIEWCRKNAPDAIKGLPDEELWDIMQSTYYKLKDF